MNQARINDHRVHACEVVNRNILAIDMGIKALSSKEEWVEWYEILCNGNDFEKDSKQWENLILKSLQYNIVNLNRFFKV